MKRIIQLLCYALVCYPLSTSSYLRMFPQAQQYMRQQALKGSPAFGKTHFIVGLPQKYTTRVTQQKNNPENNKQVIYESYFSPDDNIQQKLIEYIRNEKKSIKLAIFSFTNKQIATALCDAYARKVAIELVVDGGFLSSPHSKIPNLKQKHMPIYLYDPVKSLKEAYKAAYSNIMHNKFAIFEQNKEDQAFVWTGSFNFTKSAETNQENVVVTNHSDTVKNFQTQFEKLKERSVPYHEASKKS